MKRIGTMLAGCALIGAGFTTDVGAESPARTDRGASFRPEQQEPAAGRTVSDWLQSVLPGAAPSDAGADAAPQSEPQAPAQQPAKKRRSRTATKPEPEPEPKSEAEQRWWEEVANPVVFAFRDCLARHAGAEIRRGSQSSYPEFVTEAMHGPCKGEFATMARLILDRHDEDDFAKIAKELIATTFLPAVKQAAESAPVAQQVQAADEASDPPDPTAVLKAAMHRDKEAMFSCFSDEADRLAATSTAPADQLAGDVIRSCRPRAEAFFDKLGKLYPGAAGGGSGDSSAAILDTSYRPAIVSRIKHMRASTISSRQ